jgi:hypothetical protein
MDIQYVQFSDLLTLTSVDEVPDHAPRALRITGPDFTTAVDVVINDESSPSFVIASPNVVIAQVPIDLATQAVRSVSVISSEFRFVRESQVTFRLGRDTKKATGLICLMQTYTKFLLTTPHYDAFSPSLGGGALEALGTNADSAVGANVVAVVTRAVNVAADQMRSVQARQSQLSGDEKLMAANLLGCRYDAENTGLDVRVELIAQSGKTAIASLGVG